MARPTGGGDRLEGLTDQAALESYRAELEELQRANLTRKERVQVEKELLEVRRDLAEEELKAARDRGDSIEHILALRRAYQDLAEEVENFGKSNTETFLKQIDIYQNVINVLGEQTDAYAAAGKALNYFINLSVNATFAYDEQRAALAKLTGGLKQYEQELADTANQASLFGLSLVEGMESYNKITEQLSIFRTTTKQTRQELSLLAGQMQRLGMDNFVQNIETSIMALGMTSDQAQETQKDLLGLGMQLGPKFKKMIDSEFGPAMESLSAHTKKKAIEVFKGLAIQARKTGLEISKLMAFAEQFDTFEGAASAVGKLNAALGGNYFNSLELLKASEEDRIKMIREGIALSGKRFQDLSRFEKKFVAQALGVSSVADAHKLLRTEQDKEAEELERLTKQGEKFGLTAAQMKERLTTTRKVSEQFQMAMQNLAVALKPVIDFLSGFAYYLAMVTTEIKKSLGPIGGFVAGLVAVAAILGTIKLISATMGLLGGGGAGASSFISMKAFGGALGSMLMPIIKVAAIGVAIGAVIAAIGAGLLVLGYGMKSLGEGMKPMAEVISKYGLTAILGIPSFIAALLTSLTLGGGIGMVAALVSGPIFYLLGKSMETLGDSILNINKGIAEFNSAKFKSTIQEIKAGMEVIKKLDKSGTGKITLGLNKDINVDDMNINIEVDFKNIEQSKENMKKQLKQAIGQATANAKAIQSMTGVRPRVSQQ